MKLRDIGCLANVVKGKARGDERKIFEMSMDNNCYTSTSTTAAEPTTLEAEAEPEEEGA